MKLEYIIFIFINDFRSFFREDDEVWIICLLVVDVILLKRLNFVDDLWVCFENKRINKFVVFI